MADFFDKKLRKVAEELAKAHPNDIALLVSLGNQALAESYSAAQALASRTDVKLDPPSSATSSATRVTPQADE